MWRDLKSSCERRIKFYYYYILSCWDQQNQNLVSLCLKPKTREARLQVANLVQMSDIWFSSFFFGVTKKNAMKPWRQIEFVYFLLFCCAQWAWAHLWFNSEHTAPIEKVSTRRLPQKEKQKPCINIIFFFFLTSYIYHYNKSQVFTKRSLWPNLPSLVIVVRLYFLSPNRFFWKPQICSFAACVSLLHRKQIAAVVDDFKLRRRRLCGLPWCRWVWVSRSSSTTRK